MDGELTQTAKKIAYILATHYWKNNELPFVDANNDQAELWISGEKIDDNARVTLRWRKDAQDVHKTG